MRRIFLFLIFSPCLTLAQINENFDDGDFTNNPQWMGSTDHFSVMPKETEQNDQLRLNAPQAGQSYLATSSETLEEASWKFDVSMKFNPSSSNHAIVYLAADHHDPAQMKNAIYVEVGRDKDRVSLWTLTNNQKQLLIDGLEKRLDQSKVDVKIEVVRNDNEWILRTKIAEEWQEEGRAEWMPVFSSSYFSIFCRYTETRKDKFYFDNVIVQGEPFIDEVKPKVTDFNLVSGERIDLEFNEALDETTLSSAFQLKKLGVSPTQVNYSADDNLIELQFEPAIEFVEEEQLHITGIKDLAGNLMNDTSLVFTYYIPKRFDVVINELMADPDPSLGLPETEYLELYNHSDFTIDLEGWQLQMNQKTVELGTYELLPQSYVCIVPGSNQTEWTSFENVLPLDDWISFSNTGCELALFDVANLVIDAWQYSRDKVLREPFKKDGGWSAERIDVNNQSGINNHEWTMDLSGGTPGKENSVKATILDDQAPEISTLFMPTDTTLQLEFNESISIDDIQFGLSLPLSFQQVVDTVFGRWAQLHFNQELKLNELIKLEIIELNDWAGNALMYEGNLQFGLADSVVAGNVVINEVLFNPRPDGVDFIELYNRSEKIIRLSDLYFAKYNQANELEKLLDVSDQAIQILPAHYQVLCPEKDVLSKQYNCKQPFYVSMPDGMPSMPDDEGVVVLCNKYGMVLDSLYYTDKMHFDLVKDNEGVSLERLSFEEPTTKADNWHSTASTVGYATPTYLNSQSLSLNAQKDESLSLTPEVFSPDGNGEDDVLVISYHNEEEGGVAQVRVFDPQGRSVRHLVNNQSMAMDGTYIWDGRDDQRQLVNPGTYIVWVQRLYSSGKIKENKMVCVIGIDRQ